MSKRKVYLASILIAVSLTATGCGGGGGGGSNVVGGNDSGNSQSGGDKVISTPTPDVNGQSSNADYTYKASTNLTINGQRYDEATFDATSDTPPPVPYIER